MNRFLAKYIPEISAMTSLGLPIIFAQLGVTLMGLTDSIMVGQYLGAVPLGAAGLANSLSFLVSSIGVGGMGVVATLIAQAKGKADDHEIVQLHRTSVALAVLLGIGLCIINLLMGWKLEWFGQTVEVTRLARTFNLILAFSIIPLLLFGALRQFTDGLSYTVAAMVITFLALALNLLLNYLLINGKWFFPEMGINGSATATLLSRVFMALAMFLYIRFSENFAKYHLIQKQVLAHAKVDYQRVLNLLKLALPTGFQFFFEIAAFSLAVVMVGWLGEVQLAAHQIAISLASTTYMMATGLAAAGAIRVGQAYGRHDWDAVRLAGTSALMMVVVFMGFCCLLFLTANDFLVSLYIKGNPEVTATAITLVVIAGLFQLSDGVQVVALGALRGLSDVNLPTIITFLAYWGVALPLSYVLGFVLKMDVQGIWIALSLGLTFSAVFLAIRFYWLSNKMRAKG